MRPTPILRAALPTLAATLAIASACSRPLPPPLAKPKKTVLATLPATYRKGTLAVSDDGEHAAFVVKVDAGQQVVAAGVAGPTYKECAAPRFAPESDRLYYWATDASSGSDRLVVVAHGQVVPTEFGRLAQLVFSKDGRRWAAAGGTKAAEGAERGPVIVVADGAELGRYPDASLPAFSPDGRHIAYLAEGEDGRITLMVDGSAQRTLEKPEKPTSAAVKTRPFGPNLPPQFGVGYLADGSLIVLAQDREGWAVYRDEQRLASYASSHWRGDSAIRLDFGAEFKTAATIAPTTLLTAEKAPVALWWERQAGDEERWRVMRDGVPLDDVTCNRVTESLVVSDDGQHAAYFCIEGARPEDEKRWVVLDGVRMGPYADLFGIALSPSGEQVTFAAAIPRDATDPTPRWPWSFYVNTRPFPPRYEAVWRPRFTANGAGVAWEAEREGARFLGIDARRIATFEEVIWGPIVAVPDRVSWVVRRGRRVIRVDVPAPRR